MMLPGGSRQFCAPGSEPLATNTISVKFHTMTVTSGRNTPVWLGVDIGTQGVRAVLVDGAGSLCGTGESLLPAGMREGQRHEQDPRSWWEALCLATREAIGHLTDQHIAGVAIDSTSGTLLVVDEAGRARGPALMYDDARASTQATRAQEAGQAVWDSLGYRIQVSWALPRLCWLTEHDMIHPGDRVVHQGDYLGARLAGRLVPSDTSSALKTGYDLINECWPEEVISDLGVPLEVLPEVVRPGAQIGQVTSAAAEATGIPTGTVISAGTTDGCAAQISTGAMKPGQWSSALGTTLVIKGATDALLLDPEGSVYCHRNPDGGWLPGGASSSGAAIVSAALRDQDLAELTQRLPPFPIADFAYPLVGEGERFPFSSSAAHQVLPTGATPGGQLASIMQSVAFVERLSYDVLASLGADISGTVSFSGGATANAVWNQLRCDVLGRPVLLPRSSQAAVGAAVLAAAEPGSLAATAERMVHIQERLTPTEDASYVASLTSAYEDFADQLVRRGWLDSARRERACSVVEGARR